MATVIMHAVVSVDGFIADENDDVGPLFDWYFNGDVPIFEEAGEETHATFRIGERSHEYVSSLWGSIGATIQGRHLFDLTNGWDAQPPAGSRVVAVCAGNVGGQALALGLVDVVAMDVVPVVFGTGKRYFGPVDSQHLLEDPDVVIQGDRVVHLRYRTRR